MSALDQLTQLEKTIGRLTHEERSWIREWRRSLKTHEAYRTLKENLAFRVVMQKLAQWTVTAHEKINNRDTKDDERRDQFIMRDLGLFMLGLFDEADAVMQNLDDHIRAKTQEWVEWKSTHE